MNNAINSSAIHQQLTSEPHFRSLINEAPFSAAVLVGERLIIEAANKMALELWGKDTRVIGKPLLDATPEIETQEVYHELLKVYHTGLSYESKEAKVFADINGTQKKMYLNVFFKALHDESDHIYGVFAIGHDVTDYVASRKRIEESEERARIAVESAELGAFDWDYVTRTLVTTPRLNEIFGFPSTQPFQAYFDLFHPDDHPIRDAAHQRANTTGLLDYEARILRRDESIRWIRLKGRIFFDVNGNPVRLVGTALDFTDRKLASQKLEESEQRFRTLITETPEVASGLYVGPELRIQYVNDVMLKFWGRGPDVIGKTLDEALPELTTQPFPDQLRLVYQTGESISAQEEPAWLLTNGELKKSYFNYTYKALRDKSGNIYGIHHMAVDVTAQVESKLKYIESERRYRDLLHQAPFGICILRGTDLVVDFVNDRFLHMVSRTRQESIGQKLWNWLPEVESQVFNDLITKVQKTGIPVYGKEYELKLMRQGQLETIFVDFSYEVLRNENREPDAILALALDVTDKVLGRKEIEKTRDRFNSILETLPQIAWTTDPKGNIDYITQQWYAYTGQNEKEAHHNGWVHVLYPQDAVAFRRKWQEQLSNQSAFDIECRIKRRDGSYRWNLIRTVPVRGDGNVAFWVGTATDIHEQKLFHQELERQIQERTKELERSNSELEQFAYVSSHDLQEPLRKISTYTGMLKEHLSTAYSKVHSYLDKISASSARMSKLIKDLLAFSSVNKNETLYQAVDLNAVIDSVVIDFDLLIEQKHALIKKGKLPVVEAVPLQMNQLFYNLMSNSLKFSSVEKSPVVRIAARELAEDEIQSYKNLDSTLRFIQIEWTDNGIGFPENYADKVFVIFQRLHDAQAYAGTGIGLAICKRIVSNHHGDIFVKSEPGKGTTFFVALPMMQPRNGLEKKAQ